MSKMPNGPGAQSRFLFFFSGHGIEVFRSEQVLLPSDFQTHINDSLGIRNISDGMAPVAVTNQHYFVDACRNHSKNLPRQLVFGSQILDILDVTQFPEGQSCAILTATQPGGTAYQPRNRPHGWTIFGQALLEGLRATPDYEPVPPCDIRATQLHTFLARRTKDLLLDQSDKPGPVRLGGEFADVTLARVDFQLPPLPPEQPPEPEPVPPSPTKTPREVQVDSLKANFEQAVYSEIPDEPLRAIRVPRDKDRDMPGRLIEQFKRSMKLYSSKSLVFQTLDDNPRIELVTRSSSSEARKTRRINFVFRLSFPNLQEDHWLQVGETDAKVAVIFPASVPKYDPPENVRFEVEVEMAPRQYGSTFKILSFMPRLSEDNQGALRDAARLWKIYEGQNAAVAARLLLGNEHTALAINTLYGKLSSPLAATVAAIILVKARRYLQDKPDLINASPYVRDGVPFWSWIKNLAEWFPNLSDGAVLWKEIENRNPQAIDETEVFESRRRYFHEMEKKDLPVTADALAFLIDQVRRDAELGLSSVSSASPAFVDRIRKASSLLHSNGLFTAYIGNVDMLGRDSFLGRGTRQP